MGQALAENTVWLATLIANDPFFCPKSGNVYLQIIQMDQDLAENTVRLATLVAMIPFLFSKVRKCLLTNKTDALETHYL